MSFVMGLVDRIIVVDSGTRIAEGPPDAIRDNPPVQEVYLGGILDREGLRKCSSRALGRLLNLSYRILSGIIFSLFGRSLVTLSSCL